jgi:hypothetical protein
MLRTASDWARSVWPALLISITAIRILKIEAVTVQVFSHFPPKW